MITQELQERIYAAYWGCEVSYLYLVGDTHREASGKIVGIYRVDDNLVLDLIDGEGGIYPTDVDENQCQLVLTPLAEITDGDIEATWNVTGIGEHIIDNSKESFLRMFDPSKCAESDERMGQAIYLRVYDYLRFRGYAFEFDGIDLIEAGIAIRRIKEPEIKDTE